MHRLDCHDYVKEKAGQFDKHKIPRTIFKPLGCPFVQLVLGVLKARTIKVQNACYLLITCALRCALCVFVLPISFLLVVLHYTFENTFVI